MVELGAKEYTLNKEFGIKAAAVCSHVILIGPKRTVPIKDGLLEAAYPESSIYIATNLKHGQSYLNSIVSDGDVVLYENDLPDNYDET